jgi:hypothetical protein
VEYLRIEAVDGGVLLTATIAALALTYSPAADAYQRLRTCVTLPPDQSTYLLSP